MVGRVAVVWLLGVVAVSAEAAAPDRPGLQAHLVFRGGQVFVAKGRPRVQALAIEGERVAPWSRGSWAIW